MEGKGEDNVKCLRVFSLFRKRRELDEMQQSLTDSEQMSGELRTDMAAIKQREVEMLELVQRITARNAELQSENSALSTKVLTQILFMLLE